MRQNIRYIHTTTGQMRYRYHIILITLVVAGFFSCKKYKDTPGIRPPQLDSQKYCNDPTAVNYNWGFPGVPDNSVCFYPTQLFSGTYSFKDSVYTPDERLARIDSFVLQLNALTHSQFSVSGFCTSGGALNFTASRYYSATVDTTVADSSTGVYGQIFCSIADTVNGTFTKSHTNDSIFTVSLTVISDTGTTTHRGTAYKL
ncbi:hypothetical protein ACTHGU_11840 [Chitinophagaceae bacterium MMS25-I14]